MTLKKTRPLHRSGAQSGISLESIGTYDLTAVLPRVQARLQRTFDDYLIGERN